MLKIQSKRFGVIEAEESRVITFTEGIFGFQQYSRYILIDHAVNSPFKWLQSTEKPDLAFVVTDPLLYMPDYRAEVSHDEIEDIELGSTAKAVVMCLVTISKECSSVTINLAGPLVINFEKMLAKQVVLTNTTYSIRHSIMGASAAQQEKKVGSSG